MEEVVDMTVDSSSDSESEVKVLPRKKVVARKVANKRKEFPPSQDTSSGVERVEKKARLHKDKRIPYVYEVDVGPDGLKVCHETGKILEIPSKIGNRIGRGDVVLTLDGKPRQEFSKFSFDKILSNDCKVRLTCKSYESYLEVKPDIVILHVNKSERKFGLSLKKIADVGVKIGRSGNDCLRPGMTVVDFKSPQELKKYLDAPGFPKQILFRPPATNIPTEIDGGASLTSFKQRAYGKNCTNTPELADMSSMNRPDDEMKRTNPFSNEGVVSSDSTVEDSKPAFRSPQADTESITESSHATDSSESLRQRYASRRSRSHLLKAFHNGGIKVHRRRTTKSSSINDKSVTAKTSKSTDFQTNVLKTGIRVAAEWTNGVSCLYLQNYRYVNLTIKE